MHLVPVGKTHNDKEWEEYTIEPRVGGGGFLIIRHFVRNRDLTKVLDASKKTEKDVIAIIESVIAK
jgi:hypothetical protein